MRDMVERVTLRRAYHADIEARRGSLPKDATTMPNGMSGSLDAAVKKAETWPRTKKSLTDPQGKRILIASPKRGCV